VLSQLLIVPLVGGVLAWGTQSLDRRAPRWIAAITLLIALGLTAAIGLGAPTDGPWLAEVDRPWLPALGVRYHLAVDGLSLPLLALTWVVGLVAVGVSTEEIEVRPGLFHASVLWGLAGVAAVFMAVDLVLFYVAWEFMLVPMYLIIGIWGHERRVHAALRFFLFTQASGLLLLVSIVGLHLVHLDATGALSFDYETLLTTPIDPAVAPWLMMGFFVAFAVKVPVVPLHTWLADAHTEAPTAGSVILAGILLKTGGYGMMRFVGPLFPEASRAFQPLFLTLGAIGVLYGAWLALAQTDAKRLVAYTSVSHLGFVVMAVFAWNPMALQGALFEMVCHGLATGGLFVAVGQLSKRTGTRDLRLLGGALATMPRFSTLTWILALAALGLPGLGNFVAEALCLFGTYQASPVAAAVAGLGLVGAAAYALSFVQRALHGPPSSSTGDLAAGPTSLLALPVVALLVLGFAPRTVLDVSAPAVAHLVDGGLP